MEAICKPAKISEKNNNLVWYDILNKSGDFRVGYFSLAFSNDCSIIYLSEMYVDEHARNLGFGTFALNYIKQLCIKLGCEKLWLFVSFDNEKAQQLYKRQGFEFVNYISDYCYKMEMLL